MGALRPLFPGVYGEQRLPKASVCISLRLEPPLAKVGVEGSNPFARSNYRDAKSRGKQRLFACSGMSEAKNFEGAWLPRGYRYENLRAIQQNVLCVTLSQAVR